MFLLLKIPWAQCKISPKDPRDKGKPAQSRPTCRAADDQPAGGVDGKERLGVAIISHRKPNGDVTDRVSHLAQPQQTLGFLDDREALEGG